MNVFKSIKSRRSILRHASMASGHMLEFPAPDTVSDSDRSSGDDSAPMPFEHDVLDEIYDTDYVDPVEDEIDVDHNCSKHNVLTAVEPRVACDDLDLELGGRWLLGADSDSESEDDCEEFSADTFAQGLGEWAVSYNIQHSAVAGLLAFLRKRGILTLPSDPRTLLKTPRHYDILSMGGGEYSHVGLASQLSKIVLAGKSMFKQLDLQINIDGIPLFKSTNTSLWPILCSVNNSFDKEPFVVGIFCGKEKPADAKEFLREFVSEASDLLKNGLNVEQNIIPVTIHSFVCDAPARAFIKGIKSHSGYSSCEKCMVVGEYSGKVIFPLTSAKLRTDKDFIMRTDEDHHVRECPLDPLPIGFVSQFGLDFMHLVCLGSMRRFLMYWKGPVGPLHVRLGRKAVSDLSSRLIFLAAHVPVDFARKPRTLDDLARWKATEFRQFLLYSSVLVLDGILSDELYEHFLLLFVAIRILASQKLAVLHADYANELLIKFVSDTVILYGKESLVYNVHNLLHLAADVKNLGVLDNFSAFKFENKLGQLKKLVRKPQQPIQQVLKRLNEQASFCFEKATQIPGLIVKNEHTRGPLLPSFRGARQYKQLQFDELALSIRAGDNCIMMENGAPLLVRNIVKFSDNDDVTLLCTSFRVVTDAFMSPLPSSKLSIYKVKDECSSLQSISLCNANALCKCVCWPVGLDATSHLVIPLLH